MWLVPLFFTLWTALPVGYAAGVEVLLEVINGYGLLTEVGLLPPVAPIPFI